MQESYFRSMRVQFSMSGNLVVLCNPRVELVRGLREETPLDR